MSGEPEKRGNVIAFPSMAKEGDGRPILDLEVKNTLASIASALTILPAWIGVLGWDEFSQRLVFRKSPPFQRGANAGPVLQDVDISRIVMWFEEAKGAIVSKSLVTDAARLVARRNCFHPVRDYLSSVAWDRVSRVDTWLEDYCAVKPTSPEHQRLIRSVSRRWLVSCVARAMDPGCKVDTMLILEGRQGIGKSSVLRTLAGENFFCDSLIDFGTKDACQTIQGVWIYELSELDAILRMETSKTKAFLSRAVDKFRVPYGRSPESIPRSVVFCGTINHGAYLKDRTGNRRFWLARCEDTLNVEGLRAVRDQLWAEARVLFDEGETWHLSPKEDLLMAAEHEERMEEEPWEEKITTWVMKQGDTPIAVEHLLEAALGLQASTRNSKVTQRVHHVLDRLGYERARKNFEGKGRVYRYLRRVSPCPAAPLPYCGQVDPASTDLTDAT
jgi:putative DNA primase/helicase